MRNYIVLDTETAPLIKIPNAGGAASLVYDLGYAIVDGNTGEILQTRSFLLVDTYFNVDLMSSSYYKNKLPQYEDGRHKGGLWQEVTTLTAWQLFCEDAKTYNVRTVWAFNADFDRTTLNHTVAHYSQGWIKEFLPNGMQWGDIWDYAGSTICNTNKYVQWCINNQCMSRSGNNPSTNAETIYRYVSGELDFVERHTALQDAYIELTILQAARKRHTKARHSFGQGWRDAASIYKKLMKEAKAKKKKGR